ncbi:molybdopterin converting factor subunit 1 [Gilvimarinus algae]|uniref:Molybdopterin synthase sulfur carrier subunit n=1 Tax=Gilvimarinus algae TaxID=3058037 RepID=A0ABT8TJZ7_9GAMM|nr:molybdopterin converting factor subunit 1 [Gilvimarinus sp. SDUM040014]MDO3383905.1 molybdopterin converting factor subunit 1 [Gilvimarinus sp. SDUM040014]
MIKLVFFARLRETLGCDALTLDLDKPATAAEVIERLKVREPHWRQALDDTRLLMALNQQMIKPDAEVRPGDELALFPPVTGG